MNLPKFLFSENKSALPGAGLIICTEVPFFYAQIFKGVTIGQMTELCQKHKAIAAGMPYSYNIGVIVLGAFHTSLVPSPSKEFAQEMATLAREMSDFYLNEKIIPNEKYYERYKS